MTGSTPSGRIPGPVVGQYFAFFNGVSKQHYEEIVTRAPFEDCNLLILAFVRAIKQGDVYVAQFWNWRDNKKPPAQGDSDQDRVKLVVNAARAKNPSLKILVSLGWGDKPSEPQERKTLPWNDAGHAATTPGPFARSMASIVETFGLDGIDIDYESVEDVEPKSMLTLARELKQALSKVSSKREMIMTIAPATSDGLDASVLQAFTYTMPQTYGHGGGTTATWYERHVDSFDRIVYGLNSEGYGRRLPPGERPHPEWDRSDDPQKKAAKAKAKKAAGIFAWRLDNDSLDEQGFPTFATGREMWKLMTSTASRVDA